MTTLSAYQVRWIVESIGDAETMLARLPIGQKLDLGAYRTAGGLKLAREWLLNAALVPVEVPAIADLPRQPAEVG